MSLSALLSKLDVFANSDSHREVYDTASTILSNHPNNLVALKKCLISLINLDDYNEAKHLISKYGELIESNTASIVLELAYILYKLDESEDKLLHLKQYTNPSNMHAFNHVLAQYYYRMGQDTKALNLYYDLIKTPNLPKSEIADLAVNERAVISQLKFNDDFNANTSTIPITESVADSYDQLFNDSLILIIDGKYDDALITLNNTLKLANSVVDESDRFHEISPIKLQIAYVYILQGKFDSAMSILNEVEAELPESFSKSSSTQIIKLIIQNNKLVCNEPINAELSYRELQFPDSIDLTFSKLTIPQIFILQRNQLLLGKIIGKKSIKQLKKYNKLFPNSKLFANEDDSIFQTLVSAQKSINLGNYQSALSSLESIINLDPKILVIPSIGKLVYTLYEKINSKRMISKFLNQVADQLLSQTSKTEFTQNDIKYVQFIALKLLSFNESVSEKLLLMINCLNILNTECNDEDIEKLVSNVNVDELIGQGLDTLLPASTNTTTHKPKTMKKRLRLKPKRLPKDTSQQLDAERWLPLKDRSYYKSKKAKRNAKNTQGGMIDIGSEKTLNYSDKPAVTASSSVNTNTPSTTSSSKKSKKKKGKK